MPWRQKSGNRLEFLSICLPVRKEWFHVCSLPSLLASDLSRAGKNVESVFVHKIKCLLAQAFIWAGMVYPGCWQSWEKALLCHRDIVTSVQSTKNVQTLKVQVKPSCYQWVNKGNVQGWGNAQRHLNLLGVFLSKGLEPFCSCSLTGIKAVCPTHLRSCDKGWAVSSQIVPLTPCEYHPVSALGADGPQVSHFPLLMFLYPFLICVI